MHHHTWTSFQRAAWVGTTGLAAVLMLLAPTASAQTTAPHAGWGYGSTYTSNIMTRPRGPISSATSPGGLQLDDQQIEWQAVELGPGDYDFSQLDLIVGDGNAAGLNILLSFATRRPFYRSPTSGLMPSDPGTFGQFMQTVATRYAGKVSGLRAVGTRKISIAKPAPATSTIHLPAAARSWLWRRQGWRSGRLVLLGAPSPTGANVDGVSIDDVSYLQQLYTVNGGEVMGFFDGLSAHPSGFANPPDCTPATPECSLAGGWNNDDSFFAFTRLSQYHDVMVQNGDSRQIWITEFRVLLEHDAAAGLRVLQVRHRGTTGPVHGPGLQAGAANPVRGGDVRVEPELPARRSPERREVGLWHRPLRLQRPPGVLFPARYAEALSVSRQALTGTASLRPPCRRPPGAAGQPLAAHSRMVRQS